MGVVFVEGLPNEFRFRVPRGRFPSTTRGGPWRAVVPERGTS
jgi:hypothetical protein